MCVVDYIRLRSHKTRSEQACPDGLGALKVRDGITALQVKQLTKFDVKIEPPII